MFISQSPCFFLSSVKFQITGSLPIHKIILQKLLRHKTPNTISKLFLNRVPFTINYRNKEVDSEGYRGNKEFIQRLAGDRHSSFILLHVSPLTAGHRMIIHIQVCILL